MNNLPDKADQLIHPFKPLGNRWEWLLNLCLQANLDKRNVDTDVKKESKILNSNPHLTAKGQTLDYIKMDTISMITNNFAKMYITYLYFAFSLPDSIYHSPTKCLQSTFGDIPKFSILSTPLERDWKLNVTRKGS